MRFRSSTLKLAVVAMCAALTACATMYVTSDVRSPNSVATCHTYDWAAEMHASDRPAPAFANPLNESRLKAAISGQLQAKGVQAAAPGAPADCMVGYGIGSRTTVEGYPYGWGWGGGWGWRHGFVAGWDEPYPYAYREGRIAVDMYDGHTHQPLWHATVNQDVTALTGSDAEAKINEAVVAIFTKYP